MPTLTFLGKPVPFEHGEHGYCERCLGTGAYFGREILNNTLSPKGKCFRCKGKGWQDEADRTRNATYDNYLH